MLSEINAPCWAELFKLFIFFTFFECFPAAGLMPPLSAPHTLFALSPLVSNQLLKLPPFFAKMAPALPGFLLHEPMLAAASVTGFCNREPGTVVVVALVSLLMPLLLRAGAVSMVYVVERHRRSSTDSSMLSVVTAVSATNS
jgi:hypothetical protein